MSRDLDAATGEELEQIAAYCFALGLHHAEEGRRVLTWNDLRGCWADNFGIQSWRNVHARKFRQVYGAGYDIARMMGRINAAKPASHPKAA